MLVRVLKKGLGGVGNQEQKSWCGSLNWILVGRQRDLHQR